ncbi:cysteine proteinase [Polychaeton citri CBS 116435]|uniref:Cysteine proteinase n=1 Tax=Polychaeton citri CBS 116435 TaxID=1314669 RepID=A0A9P4QDG3_9PEZI|nr:cysteine proteinase [Polychaeton citri CBS 116435]
MGVTDEEFPLLASLGLYTANTRGDGNCLFHALSDQLYGNQDEHSSIRARVIDYMREHANYYKQFIDVHPGGGIRRNPKRKNAGAYSSPANAAAPTEEDIDRVFEAHLQTMARGGTYGDNMEITAFSSAFDVDVKIYQRDFAYMVTGGGDDSGKTVTHIAYHAWEHYSSIRNLDGPHTGLPDVNPKVLTPEEELKQREKLAQTPRVLPWQIDVVSKSLPYLSDKPTIKRALEAAKGNVDLAVSNLLDAEENASASSAQESSSVERDHDSDNETYNGPNKKQDRRLSRHSRAQQSNKDYKHHLSHLSQSGESQESFTSYQSEASSAPASSQQSIATQPTEVETDPPLKREESNPAASEAPAKPQIRLKLHPPKPPPGMATGKTAQKQLGPRRVTARERKDIKKQAQKTARKERQQLDAQSTSNAGNQPLSPTSAGLALRQKSIGQTPPVETLRTLYI